MKKTIIYLFGVLIFSIAFTSCGSSKKGCGLTSDANKIEQTSVSQKTLVTQAK